MYGRKFLLLGFSVLVGWPGSQVALAQNTSLDPAAPNQPGLAAPPLPPVGRLPPPAPRQAARPRSLRLEAPAAGQPLLKKYRLKANYPDSLSVLRAVRELVLDLQNEAYLLASADELHWTRDSVRVRLFVGPPFRWAALRNGNLGDGLLTRAGYRERLYRNAPFRPDEWVRLQERILTEAENQGFPFATVGLDSVQLTEGRIAGRVVLKRGRAVVFDSVQIVGNSKTRKEFLIKYLQIFPGQPFSQQRVAAAGQLLRQLPYLKLRAEPEVRFAKGRARLYLPLDDRPSNQFDAIVGVVPNTALNQTGVTITGDVTINLRNLKGGGKQVGLQWRKTDALSQLFDLQYAHPNFFGTPLEVSGSFNLYKQNDAFLTLRPRLQVTYPTARAGRVSFFTEQRSSRLLLDSAAYASLNALPANIDSQYSSYGLGYAWNSLDDLFFPHRGTLFTAQGAVGTKTTVRNSAIRETLYAALPERSTQYTTGLRAERYTRFGAQGVLLVRLRGEGLFNKQLFLNDLFRLGGLNSLRGFAENQYYTNAYAVGTVEFRQFTGPDAYVFLFADQAYFRHDVVGDTYADQPTGLGAGLSFRTPAGLFQFVYSVGRDRSQQLALNNSKIHFGITNRF